jgi:hypothetical protein
VYCSIAAVAHKKFEGLDIKGMQKGKHLASYSKPFDLANTLPKEK